MTPKGDKTTHGIIQCPKCGKMVNMGIRHGHRCYRHHMQLLEHKEIDMRLAEGQNIKEIREY